MSNVDGRLECLNDGTGRVTADVSGTGVAVHATADLNGQDRINLGPGDHSYTLVGTFPNGTVVKLNVTREGGVKQIGVLTVDCPQPTPTTEPPATSTPSTSAVPAVGTGVSVAPPPYRGSLPETGGFDGTLGALGAGSILLGAAFIITALFQRKHRTA